MSNVQWEPEVKQKFDIFVTKMPLFHRRIAEQLITESATANAKNRNAQIINEEDVLNAMFSGVPAPFYTISVNVVYTYVRNR